MRSHAWRPNFASYQARGGEARDAEIDARHLLGGPQLRHAGKSAPRPFEPTWIAIYDPDIGYPLKLQTERGRKSALTTADDQHIQDPDTVPIARHGPLSEGDSSDTSARAAPDPRAG